MKKASDYLSYILVHSTKTASEPNHYIRRFHEQESGFEAWRLLRPPLQRGPSIGHLLTPAEHLSSQMVRTTSTSSIQDLDGGCVPIRSESGMVIDDHLKIATVMNHLRGSIREHLLINSKPLTPWEDIRLLIDNFFSNSYIQQASRPGSTNNIQQDDINFIKKKGKGKSKGKDKSKPSSSFINRWVLPGRVVTGRGR